MPYFFFYFGAAISCTCISSCSFVVLFFICKWIEMENIKQHTVTELQFSQEILLQWLKPQFSKIMSHNCHLWGEKHWFFSVAILLEEFLSFDIKKLVFKLPPPTGYPYIDKFKTRDFIIEMQCLEAERREMLDRFPFWLCGVDPAKRTT